jgi:dienelactone hydrolase
MPTNRSLPATQSRRAYLRSLALGGTLAVAGCATASEPRIEVPQTAPLDEPTSPVVTDLPAGSVTLRAETTVESRGGARSWQSEATFDVADGRIDTSEHAPREGAFEGRKPMGPFWAMNTDADPDQVVFPLQTHEVALSVHEPDGPALARATTERRLPALEIQDLGEDLVGTVHLPPEEGPAPGILVLHGSGGEELTRRARLLAANGFVAATLQYFGGPAAVPYELAEVPLEYVERAVETLATHERVARKQVGLYGVSKGAELALLVGSITERVGAVVSIVGSGLVWAGGRGRTVANTSTWSLDGEPVPSVPIPREEYARTGTRPTFAAGFEAASGDEIEAATIPVERIDGPVLLVSGREDGLWDSVAYSEIAADRLRRHDHPYTSEHLVYDDAGHLIRPPYAPTYGLSQAGPVQFGGTPAGNAEAAADHWPQVLSLFGDALG